MPYYNYKCLDCPDDPEPVFETRHAMCPSPEELAAASECPRCSGHNTVKVLGTFTTYTRGYGYLDRSGCHRDMNVHKLTTEDPYASMREPGEAADLKLRLQRGGKHNPNTKHHFAAQSDNADMIKAVDSVANSPDKS